MISCRVRWRVAGALWLALLGACADEPAERPRAATNEEPRARQGGSPLAEPGRDAPPNVESASNATPLAGQYIQGALVQLIPHLAPRLPDTALGTGARWGSDTGSIRLISGDATSLRIERRDALSYPQPLGNGQTITVDEEQTYRIAARTNGVSSEVEATLETRGSDGTRRSTRMRFDLEH